MKAATTTPDTKFRTFTPAAEALAASALGPHLDALRVVRRSPCDIPDDDVLQAVHAVMRDRTPDAFADDDRLSDTLDDRYNAITGALKEAALIVGIQIGRTLAGRDVPAPVVRSADGPVLDTDAPGASIGDRLDRITGTLGLIHAAAAALRADVKIELHDGEVIDAIKEQSAACIADLWWIETADKKLLDTPAPTTDEHAALTKGAR